jgi:hypothetical protein
MKKYTARENPDRTFDLYESGWFSNTKVLQNINKENLKKFMDSLKKHYDLKVVEYSPSKHFGIYGVPEEDGSLTLKIMDERTKLFFYPFAIKIDIESKFIDNGQGVVVGRIKKIILSE